MAAQKRCQRKADIVIIVDDDNDNIIKCEGWMRDRETSAASPQFGGSQGIGCVANGFRTHLRASSRLRQRESGSHPRN